MSDKTEEVRSTPVVPMLAGLQLDIDGELREFGLRFDLLAARKIDKEAKDLGDELDRVMQVVVSLKHFLWPRNHGLGNDDILASMSPGSLKYIEEKLVELAALTRGKGNPMAGSRQKRPSRMKNGGSSKQAPGSASISDSPNSGTQPLPS